MTDSQLPYTSDLTESLKAALAERMKEAWARLPKDTQNHLKPLLDTAHAQFADFVKTGAPPDHELHTILRMKSHLTDDWDGLIDAHNESLALAPVEIQVGVGENILSTGNPRISILCGNWRPARFGSSDSSGRIERS